MAKFKSPTIVQRKLGAKFGKECIKRKRAYYCNAFMKLVRLKSGSDQRESSKITEEKIDEVHHVTKN